MAREGAFILDVGDEFPHLTLATVNHGGVTLPEGFGGHWGVFLIYRGHW